MKLIYFILKNLHISNVPLYNMINGVWCCGNYKNNPLTFENTNIVLNWSYYELRLELYGDKKEIDIILNFYEEIMNYGEWGEKLIKPIVFIEISGINKFLKSKKYLSIDEIKEYLKDENFFKIVIFFETTIQDNPLEEKYERSNSHWISCIGGLYYVADMLLFFENNDKIYECIEYKNNKVPFVVNDYSWENLDEYVKETTKSAKDLVKYSNKWNIFKWNADFN